MAYVVHARVAKEPEKGLVFEDITFGNRLPSSIQSCAAVLARYLESAEGELTPQEGECFEVRILVSKVEGSVTDMYSVKALRERHLDLCQQRGFQTLKQTGD